MAQPADLGARAAEFGALEQDGKHRRAAVMAEETAQSHPQDYGWRMRAAWARFQAKHYRRAAKHYRRAIELSGGSLESRLGLAWSLLYDGQRAEASAELQALKRDHPEAPEVDEALAFDRARPRVAVRPWISGTGHVYGNHPELRRGFGLAAGVGLTIFEHTLVSASYGFSRISLETDPDLTGLTSGPGSGPGPGPGGGGGGQGGNAGFGRGAQTDTLGTTVEQHQVHVAVGPTWTTGGGLVQYGYLRDEGLDDVHALGLSLRWSPWGDIVLSNTVTIEPGQVRPRFAPSWTLPVHEHVWVRPGVSLQVDDRVLASGSATVGLRGRPGGVWLGGKYGRERRPAYLDTPVIFNLAGDIRWGAWLGASLVLPAGFGVFAHYELNGIEAQTATSTVDAQAHYITVGLSFTHS